GSGYVRRRMTRADFTFRFRAMEHRRGLPRIFRVFLATTRATALRVIGLPAAARRASWRVLTLTIEGTARTAGLVARRRRRILVRTAVPRTMCGSTFLRIRRSRRERTVVVEAPIIAS